MPSIIPTVVTQLLLMSGKPAIPMAAGGNTSQAPTTANAAARCGGISANKTTTKGTQPRSEP